MLATALPTYAAETFRSKLAGLDPSRASISSTSQYLQLTGARNDADVISSMAGEWLRALAKPGAVSSEFLLASIYLVNDVLMSIRLTADNGKMTALQQANGNAAVAQQILRGLFPLGLPEETFLLFHRAFGTVLAKALAIVGSRGLAVVPKVKRVVGIWQEKQIFSPDDCRVFANALDDPDSVLSDSSDFSGDAEEAISLLASVMPTALVSAAPSFSSTSSLDAFGFSSSSSSSSSSLSATNGAASLASTSTSSSYHGNSAPSPLTKLTDDLTAAVSSRSQAQTAHQAYRKGIIGAYVAAVGANSSLLLLSPELSLSPPKAAASNADPRVSAATSAAASLSRRPLSKEAVEAKAKAAQDEDKRRGLLASARSCIDVVDAAANVSDTTKEGAAAAATALSGVFALPADDSEDGSFADGSNGEEERRRKRRALVTDGEAVPFIVPLAALARPIQRHLQHLLKEKEAADKLVEQLTALLEAEVEATADGAGSSSSNDAEPSATGSSGKERSPSEIVAAFSVDKQRIAVCKAKLAELRETKLAIESKVEELRRRTAMAAAANAASAASAGVTGSMAAPLQHLQHLQHPASSGSSSFVVRRIAERPFIIEAGTPPFPPQAPLVALQQAQVPQLSLLGVAPAAAPAMVEAEQQEEEEEDEDEDEGGLKFVSADALQRQFGESPASAAVNAAAPALLAGVKRRRPDETDGGSSSTASSEDIAAEARSLLMQAAAGVAAAAAGGYSQPQPSPQQYAPQPQQHQYNQQQQFALASYQHHPQQQHPQQYQQQYQQQAQPSVAPSSLRGSARATQPHWLTAGAGAGAGVVAGAAAAAAPAASSRAGAPPSLMGPGPQQYRR